MKGENELKENLEQQKKRRKGIKNEVEKRMQKMNDYDGISTLGTFKSDEEIRGYMRKREKQKK